VYLEAPGVEVVTPLRLTGTTKAIMVNRGFVASPDAMTTDLDSLNEPGVVEVRGIALPLPTSSDSGKPLTHLGRETWRRLDLPALRARLPYPVIDVYILQSPDSALPRHPIRLEPPPLDNGPHLSYAIQWFSFATIAVVGGWLFLWRGKTE
jgi:surfeit locus 1 family protein